MAHTEDDGEVHVDAARDGDHFVAVAMRAKDGSTLAAASVRTREVRIAEEVAIALTVSSRGVTTVFSDFMVAIRNYIMGRASTEAVWVLKGGNPSAVTIRWFLAHEAGNAMVDALARAMTDRANRQASRYDPREYGKIIRNQRLGRRRMPPPFRRLQTRFMFTPVFGKHVLLGLYQDDQCVLCKSARATLAHIMWDCPKRPEEASREEGLPPELQEAIRSEN